MISYTAPPAALATELSEVRTDAAALAEAFRQLNAPLPLDFPKAAVLELAAALSRLPDGTARGCLRPLNEAQAQLAVIRSQHILHDDLPASRAKEGDQPSLLRGELIDQKLRHLMSSVSTALQTANRLAAEESEPALPEPSVDSPNDASVMHLIEKSSKAQSELEQERSELDSLRTPMSERSDTLRRRLTDAIILNILGRGELRMPRIVAARLRRIGSALRDYPKLLQQAADAVAKGADVADYAYHKWHKLKERLFTAGTSTVREIAEDIINYAKRLEATRSRGRQSTLPPNPPADFDILEATRMIHEGKSPPASWKPYIDELPLGNRRLKTLSPLAGVTNLRMLDKVSVRVSDISPLASMSALRTINLSSTSVRDIQPLSGLTSLQYLNLNGTEVENLAPLAGLSLLRQLHLDGTNVKDLSSLVELQALEYLDLDGTKVEDLSPLASLSSLKTLRLANTPVRDISPLVALPLTGLYINGTKVEDFAPASKLKSLRILALDKTGLQDLSPVAELSSLNHISFDETGVTNLQPLANSHSLESLHMRGAKVSDLRPITNLKSLTSIYADKCDITSLDGLSNLRSLQTLSVDDTAVADLAPLAESESLSSLSIERTLITNLEPIKTLKSLSTLWIKGTKIKEIPEELTRRRVFIVK